MAQQQHDGHFHTYPQPHLYHPQHASNHSSATNGTSWSPHNDNFTTTNNNNKNNKNNHHQRYQQKDWYDDSNNSFPQQSINWHSERYYPQQHGEHHHHPQYQQHDEHQHHASSKFPKSFGTPGGNRDRDGQQHHHHAQRQHDEHHHHYRFGVPESLGIPGGFQKRDKVLVLLDMNGTLVYRRNVAKRGIPPPHQLNYRCPHFEHGDFFYYMRPQAFELIKFCLEHSMIEFAMYTSMRKSNALPVVHYLLDLLIKEGQNLKDGGGGGSCGGGGDGDGEDGDGQPYLGPEETTCEGLSPSTTTTTTTIKATTTTPGQGPGQAYDVSKKKYNRDDPVAVDIYDRDFNQHDPNGVNDWDTMRDLPRVWAFPGMVGFGHNASSTIMIDDTFRKMRRMPDNVLVVGEFTEDVMVRGDDAALLPLIASLRAVMEAYEAKGGGDVRDFIRNRRWRTLL